MTGQVVQARRIKRRIAYKLFRQRKDGSLGSLFINRRQQMTIGEWLNAEDHPTKGYAHRPSWHTSSAPSAPHLSERNRVWYRVEISDYYPFPRPANQGGEWLIARKMRVLEPTESRS